MLSRVCFSAQRWAVRRTSALSPPSSPNHRHGCLQRWDNTSGLWDHFLSLRMAAWTPCSCTTVPPAPLLTSHLPMTLSLTHLSSPRTARMRAGTQWGPHRPDPCSRPFTSPPAVLPSMAGAPRCPSLSRSKAFGIFQKQPHWLGGTPRASRSPMASAGWGAGSAAALGCRPPKREAPGYELEKKGCSRACLLPSGPNDYQMSHGTPLCRPRGGVGWGGGWRTLGRWMGMACRGLCPVVVGDFGSGNGGLWTGNGVLVYGDGVLVW